jgi:hypothetical protein
VRRLGGVNKAVQEGKGGKASSQRTFRCGLRMTCLCLSRVEAA